MNLQHCTLMDAPPMVVSLVFVGHAEVQATYPFILECPKETDFVIWAEIDKKPVAVTLNDCTKQGGRCWFAKLAYVLPEVRRRGFLFASGNLLRELAVQDKVCRRIEWTTHPDNVATIEANKKVGRKPAKFLYNTDIEEMRRVKS